MFETGRKCRQAGIRATFNLILGYPGETERDRCETLRVMSEIGQRFDNVTFSPNIFTPYPGIPIWPELRNLGVKEPETLEAWSTIALGTNMLPWLRGEPYRNVKRSMSFFMLNNEITKLIRRGSLVTSAPLPAARVTTTLALAHEALLLSMPARALGREKPAGDAPFTPHRSKLGREPFGDLLTRAVGSRQRAGASATEKRSGYNG